MSGTGDESDVVFLFGAGASKAAGVPDTHEFVDVFRQSLDPASEDAQILDRVLDQLRRWRGETVDIECLLEALTRIEERHADPGVVFCRDASPSEPGLVDASRRLSVALRNCIKMRTYVAPDTTSYMDPLMDFVRHYGCIDIATLNYDTAIEEFGYRHRVEVHDGFRPDWDLASLQAATTGIRLYKLHGSVTWYQSRDGRHVKDIARVDTSSVELVQAGSAESLMLYPARKWAYSEPMTGLLSEFKRKLESPATGILVVVGYSFRDDHVQGVVRDAARNNTRLEVVLIDPSSHILRNRLFYNTTGSRWPQHLLRRVLCLPYRFEALLPRLKHEYIRSLRSAVDGESKARLAEARGEAPIHWTQAAKGFGACEHESRLSDALSRPSALKDGDIEKLGMLLTVHLNAAIGGGPEAQQAAVDAARRLLREMAVDRVQCEFRAAPEQIDTWVQIDPSTRIPAQNFAGHLDQLLERLRRTSELAVRVTTAARTMEILVSAVRQVIAGLGRPRGTMEDWIEQLPCPPATRAAALEKLRAFRVESGRARGGYMGGSELSRELSEALTRVARAGAWRQVEELEAAPR